MVAAAAGAVKRPWWRAWYGRLPPPVPASAGRAYTARMLWRTLLLLSLTSAVASAQVRGRVLGFDGKPAAAVVLNLLDDKGEYVADVESRNDGSFAFPGDQSGVSVRAWLEGVVLTRPVQQGRAEFDFKAAPCFTLRGNVVDPEGVPVAGLTLFCSAANDDCLAAAVTDGKGVFHVRLNQAVDHLLVDPPGWRHRVAGPYTTDAGVAVDLRLEKQFFRLQGTLRDENRALVSGATVNVLDDKENVATARTGTDGHWTVWCNRPASRVWFAAGVVEHVLAGAWRAAATVDLDWRSAGFVVLTGRALDAAGHPVADAKVIPLEDRSIERHLPSPIAVTDAEGRFRALVPSWARHLYAWAGDHEMFADGPWSKDAAIELRPSK